MTLYTPYLIYIAISILSFIVFFIIRKVRKNEKMIGNGRLIKIVLAIVVLYFLVKIIFGWRLNWYTEAVIIIGLCVSFDYLIILKKQYSANIKTMYFTLRFLSFGVPIILILGVVFFSLITLGFGSMYECYAFPIDHSYGEQKVYRNLYIYKNDCYPDGVGGFSFKKKFLFLEKDVLTIYGYYNIVYSGNWTAGDPPAGYISQDKDTIFITGKSYMPDSRKHIRVTILSTNSVQIESVSPVRYPPAIGEKVETVSYQKKIIRL